MTKQNKLIDKNTKNSKIIKQNISAFNDFNKRLSRFSFNALLFYIWKESKKIIPSIYSQALLDINNSGNIFPWELETACTLLLLRENLVELPYQKQLKTKDEERSLNKFFKSLRDYEGTLKFESIFDYVELNLILQFPSQWSWRILAYRWNFILNYQDDIHKIKDLFKEKFGFSFNEILEKIYILQLLLSVEEKEFIQNKKFINDYFKKHKKIFGVITIDYSKWKEIQNQSIIDNNYDFYYCYKLFWNFPIIKLENDVLIPLPHLLLNGFLNGIFPSFTKDNNALRSQLGFILEKYILKIAIESNLYQVKDELIYRKNKNDVKSSDIHLLKDNAMVCIESKLSTPSKKYRHLDFDKENITKEITNAIIQTFTKIKDYQNKLYNPFSEKVSDDNIFGIVVVNEDNFLNRENLYEYLKNNYSNISETENKFIKSNIFITTISHLEEVIIRNIDLIKSLKFRRDNPMNWYDFTLTFETNSEERNEKFNEFCIDLQKIGTNKNNFNL